MKISIVNAGPVKQADIDLKDMVVFVGPNNAGKSFVATIMYASLSQTGVASSVRLARSLRHPARSVESEDIESEISSYLESVLADGDSSITYNLMPPAVREFFENILRESLLEYATSVAEEISRTTGVSLQLIRRTVRRRARRAVIEISSEDPAWTVRLEIGANTTEIKLRDPDLSDVWARINTAVLRRFRRSVSRPSSLPRSLVMRDILADVVRACFREVPLHTKYLPAARSGILQSHKALAGSLVRRSTLAGIEDLRIPAMSGVVTDFLSEMIELDSTVSGDFGEDALSLEADILHGEIGLPGEPTAYPEVVYHTPSGDYPLGRTSSMVSELAPVVLYLRHRLRRRDLLFIEEPEAHLHPRTQVLFARSLVRLVNKDLRIVLTTHSEFFLQLLNNAILAGSKNRAAAERAGFSLGYDLEGNRVAAYFFSPTPTGTVVTELPVKIEEGISESSFGAVSELLYNEAVALDRSARRAEG